MLTRLLDLLFSFFPCEEPMYITAEVVGGPWDGAHINIGHGGHMYQWLPHRPDQTALSEVAALYEWSGLRWDFKCLAKRDVLIECGGKAICGRRV